MKPERISDEVIAEVLKGLREELLPPPAPATPILAPPRRGAKILKFPPRLSEQELLRRQQALDCAYERMLAQRAELEAEAHSGLRIDPGDPDYRLR